MPNLPPLRALQIFETLGHCLSVQDSARRLGITPGAVSQQLKLLEQHLHTALIFKTGKQLALTEAGERFHFHCVQAFEQLREAQSELHHSQHDHSLAISALPSMLKDWLSPRIFAWQAEQTTKLSVQIWGGHSEPDLESSQIDFRISYGQSIWPKSQRAELYTDCVVPVLSPHLLNQPLREPAQLCTLPLLATDWQPKFSSPPSWRDWFDRFAPRHCGEPLIPHQVYSLSHMAIEAAIAGQGVVLAQYASVQEALAQGRLVMPFPYALALPWPYILLWRANAFEKPACQDFHRWILAQAKTQQAACEALLAQ